MGMTLNESKKPEKDAFIGVRVPKDLKARLLLIAKRDGVSLSRLIVRSLSRIRRAA